MISITFIDSNLWPRHINEPNPQPRQAKLPSSSVSLPINQTSYHLSVEKSLVERKVGLLKALTFHYFS